MRPGAIISYKHLNGINYVGQVTYSNKEYITTKVLKGGNVGTLQFIMRGNNKIKIKEVKK